ncbi:MAG: phosphoglycerate dehydrogenase [Bdellovibrio sp.]|nr:MAG: phosphoglycerate dehydrogenase [Bdellovibrio sp.]
MGSKNRERREFMKKILLLEGIHKVARDILEEQGFYVEEEKGAFASEEDLINRAKGFHALGIRSKSKISQGVLEKLQPHLEVLGAFCIGTNQVDLEYANQCGVPVFNAPYSNTRSVAELVIANIISLARHLGDCNMKAHKGIWSKTAIQRHEVRGKVLGIVGYGHIGSQVSVLAEALGLKVIYYDIVKKLPLGNAEAKESLEEVLKEADFVSFHVPETHLTKGMMGINQFRQMKEGAYLINASRGSVVDISALVEVIQSQKLRGAAIDVFPKEPPNNKEPFVSELQGLPNVILTPHIGGSTEEAQKAIGQEVALSLTQFFKRGSTSGAVNFPNLEVPPIKDFRRIINVHKNVPGVLGEINKIVSENSGNIQAQHLATDTHIGYVVMDIGGCEIQKVAQEISQLKTSIRTQVLEHFHEGA